MTTDDPFVHHPELRGRIRPAAESFFRDLDLAQIDAHAAQAGRPADWRTPDEQREAGRRAWFAGRAPGDLWVFGYGSLMWDPAMEFVEVRRAHAPGYARSFCLWDEGGRGTVDRPGLMLAMVEGGGCDGMAFRVAAAAVEHESFVLFRREMIAPAYRPVWMTLHTDHGVIEALGFAANHAYDSIVPGLALDEQARMIARAEGVLGTNLAYLEDTHAHLQVLGIDDPHVTALHARVKALRTD